MKKKLLGTTLLSVSLLSINLFAGTQTKCTGGFCMVDLSTISPKSKEQKPKINKISKEGYKTVMVDNIATIVFSNEKYVMTQGEVAEYDLEKMQEKNSLSPTVDSSIPDYACEDNLKLVKVVGIDNTYECT